MDKSKYHAANEHALGVKLRRFQQWFHQEAEFKQRIKEKAKPKVEKTRKQNKVVCQGEREHFTLQVYTSSGTSNPAVEIWKRTPRYTR